MKTIQELIKRVEDAISKTPSGELRNLLCDINIVLQYQLSHASEIIDCTGLDENFTKPLKELVKIYRHYEKKNQYKLYA